MRGLILATQFLTRLPTPQVADFEPADLTRCAVWFPAVGLIIGALLAALALVASGQPPMFAAMLLLGLWTWVTGGLHLDGLADLADALGAAHSMPERFLEVLKDPHLGSFGVIALVLLLLAKFTMLALLPVSSIAALLLIPAWARLGPLVWVWWLPPLHGGMGDRFAWQRQPVAMLVWAATLVAASVWLSPRLLIAPILIAAWGLFLKRRLDGQCGDALGAGIEVVELGLLAALVVNPALG
ncbi:adenosylcobinamide-GDP ribazoletransferase [Nevskia sp.]|uniref:adenosylcobinamide-GDP ribazoletransferase n=1 Tax=Nevskia sp. TaxID=1929292 RepID=UPI0025FBB1A6|nr:adenosylcobinamide-GDP ribazoletransferase [Nevskia sp.]